jgi:hypothetical protein
MFASAECQHGDAGDANADHGRSDRIRPHVLNWFRFCDVACPVAGNRFHFLFRISRDVARAKPFLNGVHGLGQLSSRLLDLGAELARTRFGRRGGVRGAIDRGNPGRAGNE